MDTISYTAARGNLSKTMAKVCENHSPVVITRKSEQPVIMMSLEDYESLEETAYLMRSPTNAQRLLDAVAEISAGEAIERELNA